MGEGRNVYGDLVGKPEGKGPLERQGVDGRISKLGKLAGRLWFVFTCFRIETGYGLL
jgi:hypothetical protein